MQVHYWELGHYNGGILKGKWFDLDGKTKDDHMAEVTEWLEELTEETGELCEEIILGDVEEVPSGMYWEYGLNDELWEYIEALDTLGYDKEVIDAAIACDVPIEHIENAYVGSHEDDEDFAWEFIESTGVLADVPDTMKNYFDIKSYARDLMMEHASDNGHYFSLHY